MAQKKVQHVFANALNTTMQIHRHVTFMKTRAQRSHKKRHMIAAASVLEPSTRKDEICSISKRRMPQHGSPLLR